MAGLMSGKRGLEMGVANEHSIAWGIATKLAAEGAQLALTYHPNMAKRVKPLAESIGASMVLPCDVALECDTEDPPSLDQMFTALADRWDTIDFVVHAVAYSDRGELSGRYADTSRANFVKTMLVSCFSFTETMNRAATMMPSGASALTLSYIGASRVMPNYNVMGVAKAALEASVRYLAVDLGANGIRVNAISAGPVRTLAASGVANARAIYNHQKRGSPLRRSVSINELGGTAAYLLSDLGSGVTGEVHFVDTGFNVVGMTRDALASS